MFRTFMALVGALALVAVQLPTAAQFVPGAFGGAGSGQEQLDGIRLQLRALRDELKFVVEAQSNPANSEDQRRILEARAAQIAQEIDALRAQEHRLTGS